jgi:murein DD-endopeptidase MepM/ murein hydrolase activator NlpD
VRLLVFLLALYAALPAAAMEIDGQLTQGGLLVGKAEPGVTVTLDGEALRVAPDGRFLFGFHRDQGPEARLSVAYPDGRSERLTLAIQQRDYEIQRIEGLPQEQVTPPQEFYDRLARERAEVAEARSGDYDFTFAFGPYIWPARGVISGVYGSQRILNGEPRQPHYGVDVAAPEGTPVIAPAAGLVTLAVTDHYYTGGTIIIDHGYGVTSTLMHMQSVTVEKGQRVAQGDLIGTIGATGRATGPHLDWRMNWGERRIDPALLLGPMPQAAQ